MENCVVSVVIPVYNEEKYIEKCLRSLCEQTYPKDKMEWLFVDGLSEDKTVEIIQRYEKEYPICLLTNEKRKTPIAMNLGISQAKGEYIIRMDAHASFPPEYIEKCVYYLETTDAANVGGVADTQAEGFIGESISKMLSSPFGVGGSEFRIGGASGYVDTVPFGAFRKTVFEEVGLFNPQLLRSEDNDINARIRANGGKIWLADDIRFTYYCRDTVQGLLKMGLQNGNALFWTLRENPKAMSARHFVPFLFLLSLLVMPILSALLPFVGWVFACELGAYFLLDVWFSFANTHPRYGIVTVWLYPVFHIVYGLGSVLGMVGIALY